MKKIRIMLVDDHKFVVQSLKVLLDTEEKDLEVVGTAMDGREAVTLAGELKPDIILIDIRMPVMDGVEATRIIKAADPGIHIIILTTFDNDEYVQDAIHAGAVGYLLKDISTDELVSAIRAVKSGSVLMSPQVALKLLSKKENSGSPEKTSSLETMKIPSWLRELTKRECQVLELLGKGKDNQEIADALGISLQTVKNYVSVIYSKLGAENRRQAKDMFINLKSREGENQY
jgi:DNA-binding NarL/FixJ family response regulator